MLISGPTVENEILTLETHNERMRGEREVHSSRIPRNHKPSRLCSSPRRPATHTEFETSEPSAHKRATPSNPKACASSSSVSSWQADLSCLGEADFQQFQETLFN